MSTTITATTPPTDPANPVLAHWREGNARGTERSLCVPKLGLDFFPTSYSPRIGRRRDIDEHLHAGRATAAVHAVRRGGSLGGAQSNGVRRLAIRVRNAYDRLSPEAKAEVVQALTRVRKARHAASDGRRPRVRDRAAVRDHHAPARRAARSRFTPRRGPRDRGRRRRGFRGGARRARSDRAVDSGRRRRDRPDGCRSSAGAALLSLVVEAYVAGSLRVHMLQRPRPRRRPDADHARRHVRDDRAGRRRR